MLNPNAYISIAVPPTNGWMLDLKYGSAPEEDSKLGYRIYISGDTLLIDGKGTIKLDLHQKRD